MNIKRTKNKPLKESEVTINIKPHSWAEDLFAISIGSVSLSFGIALFAHVQFLIGGTAGLAFLGSYASNFTFGQIFFTLNIPFYILAIYKLGWVFTAKTFTSVLLVSVFTDYIPNIFEFGEINPFYAAILGGVFIGNGLLILFRHKASLGGLNIVSIYLQKFHGVNAGTFQMVVDVLIIIGAIFIVDIDKILYSILGAIFLNLVLAVNHRKNRYLVLE